MSMQDQIAKNPIQILIQILKIQDHEYHHDQCQAEILEDQQQPKKKIQKIKAKVKVKLRIKKIKRLIIAKQTKQKEKLAQERKQIQEITVMQ